jgi:uncharacterized C2H2 Zn-finger protein
MVTLTMRCSRCGKEIHENMTDRNLSNDIIRQFGFSYAHDGKENILICTKCEALFKDLKARLGEHKRLEMCNFFKNCGEEENGNIRGRL